MELVHFSGAKNLLTDNIQLDKSIFQYPLGDRRVLQGTKSNCLSLANLHKTKM